MTKKQMLQTLDGGIGSEFFLEKVFVQHLKFRLGNLPLLK